ncbi:hypothetical protein So717_37000 [Roseobacter cerasinus]|uniref:Uncharacterized protein n=1 Tax=Roseobacter cerasinus TaxID=2602289 RepID=A0A640VVR6_9RHOB|nr:hypothetical protein [Roseobacter cerasinus]GFE51947.1 hypothetical protein So717_37000 [Roseobacter cerasinus]
MGPNGNPNNPALLRQGLAAADGQPAGDVGQICEDCPDNWVEAGAVDDSTGQPLPGIGYRIYDMASGDRVASGVLNDEGLSPRHYIPVPVTQLYVIFGTDAAMDEAEEQIGARQRDHALQQDAVSEWRGIPAGLDEQGFNQAYDQIAREAGRYEKPSAGLFEGAGYGANMLWDYVSSGFDSQHMLNELYLDDRRRNFEQYELATNARQASDAESFFGGGGQGLTFGFGEEGMARLETLFSDRSYEELVAERRQLMNAERLANPNWFVGGELAGAVPTIFVPAGGAAANAARAGQGVRGAVTAGARTGAATGGLSGAGHDEGGVLDRLDGAALGAATGGLAGAVLSGAGVLIARGIAKTRIMGRIPRSSAFMKDADPARRVMGPATRSHPNEIAAMKAELEKAGVEVIERPGAMAYGPSGSGGKPGQFIIDPDASYSAWSHEYQHFLQDRASGWQGMRILTDKNVRWAWEQEAFAVEKSMMRRLGHTSVLEELDELQTLEWQRIFKGWN